MNLTGLAIHGTETEDLNQDSDNENLKQFSNSLQLGKHALGCDGLREGGIPCVWSLCYDGGAVGIRFHSIKSPREGVPCSQRRASVLGLLNPC